MPEILLSTREVAEHLHINEKQVYRLIRNGGIPCTRVTGKWLFPKSLVEEWVQQSARAQPLQIAATLTITERFGLDRGLLVAGSNDLLFDVLLEETRHHYPEYLIYTTNLGSIGGLEALQQGKAHIALAHLRDPVTEDYNTAFLRQYFPPDAVVAVTLWQRRVGFLQRPGESAIESFVDLRQSKKRFINRQRGSGIRWLIEQRLQEATIKPAQIKGYEVEAWTHWEVGLAVLHGQADVGVATESAARMLGLAFQQLVEERFDFVMRKDYYFTKPVQAVIAVLTTPTFKQRADALRGYVMRETGKIAFPN